MRTASARRLLVVNLLCLSTLALAAPGARASGADCPGADAIPQRGEIRDARRAVLCLLNHERARQGLRALRSNARLTRAATRHSRAMRERRFFAHTSPTGTTVVGRVLSAGYLRSGVPYSVGENIGWGTGVLATPREMVAAWMDSPGHRANILRASFRDIGIGIVSGDPNGGAGATYTTDFGRRG